MPIRSRRLAALAAALGALLVAASPALALKPVNPIPYRGANMHLWYVNPNSDGSLNQPYCTQPTGSTGPDQSITADLDRIDKAAGNAVRVDVSWSSLMPPTKNAGGTWDGGHRIDTDYLGYVSCVVTKAHARGIKVLLTLLSTPCWTSTAPDANQCNGPYWNRKFEGFTNDGQSFGGYGVGAYEPSSYSDYGDAVKYLVGQFGADLIGVEVWNEPNYDEKIGSVPGQEWRAFPNLHRKNVRPDDMEVNETQARDASAEIESKLTEAAWAGVEATAYKHTTTTAPVKVLTGSLSYADAVFLDTMYTNNATTLAGKYDEVSFHPYIGARSPYWDQPSGWVARYDFKGGIPKIHNVMVTHGDGTKPVFLSEFGWSTCSSGDRECVPCQSTTPSCLPYSGLISPPAPTQTQRETLQAGFIRQAFQVAASYDYVDGATLYEIRNRPKFAGDDPNDREHQYGVVASDGTAKLGYAALQQASRGYAPGFYNGAYKTRTLNTTGLTAYYRLGESSGTLATDAQGSNDGTYAGTVKLNEWPAILGATDASAWFDGGHMTATDSPALRMDAFTIEFAIAPESWGDTSKWRRILSKGTGASTRNYLIALKQGTTSKLYASVGSGGSTQSVTSSQDLPPQVWTHVAFSRETGGKLHLYINGVEDATWDPGTTTVADPPQDASPLMVGGDSTLDASEEASHVRLDELAFYNRALPASRIEDDVDALNAADFAPAAPTGLTATSGNGSATLD
ncbi:MAG TPA: LamG-like jellyroll fold domain-containing protein [Solirubrobacteraceae bacterium]|jgi:hypothetical protein